MQEDIKEDVLKKIASNIPEKEMQKFTFAKKEDVNWKEDNEFEYQGSMYDVIKREENEKFIVLYCFNDVKEANLIASFKKQFDEERTKRSNSTEKINLTNFSFTAIPGQIFRFNCQHSLCEQILIRKILYKSFCMEVISPPPKCS